MAVSQTWRGRDIRLGQRCRNLGSIEILRGDGKDGSPKNSERRRSRHKGIPHSRGRSIYHAERFRDAMLE